MYEIQVEKKVAKAMIKTPKKIREKYLKFYSHLQKFGTQNFPFPIDTIKGKMKKEKIMEAKLDKDFRIFFKKEGQIIYILLDAGTHNKLGTG